MIPSSKQLWPGDEGSSRAATWQRLNEIARERERERERVAVKFAARELGVRMLVVKARGEYLRYGKTLTFVVQYLLG